MTDLYEDDFDFRRARKTWGREKAEKLWDMRYEERVMEHKIDFLDLMHDKGTRVLMRKGEELARQIDNAPNPVAKRTLMLLWHVWEQQLIESCAAHEGFPPFRRQPHCCGLVFQRRVGGVRRGAGQGAAQGGRTPARLGDGAGAARAH
jgi:hypothetical protein